MMKGVRMKVREYAKENGYPLPGNILPLITHLTVRHRCSTIMTDIDGMIDRLIVLNGRLSEAIEENNLVAVVLIKERLDEEKAKLRAYERLVAKEAPMFKRDVDTITDEMIQRAKEYPFEDLLPHPLKRGRCACPVHTGKNNQSFSVKNNRGKCHSCGWFGDTIKYVMDTEGYSFPQAVMRLQ